MKKDEIKNLANNIRKNIMDNASKEEVNNYINNLNDILYEKMKNYNIHDLSIHLTENYA